MSRVPLPTDAPTESCAGECAPCVSAGSCGDRIVCRCMKVTEDAVIRAVCVFGAETVPDLMAATGAGGGCMACRRELRNYLAVYTSRPAVAVS
jgi:bacterioferritin-associated ferredoxin